MTVQGGSSSGFTGGPIVLTGGNGGRGGGAITLTAGSGFGSCCGDGTGSSLLLGAAGWSGPAGSVTLTAGNGANGWGGGDITLNGGTGSTSGNIILANLRGNVGIGTISPGARLEVSGQVKITGGSPGAGKVLTSDSSGLASWVMPDNTDYAPLVSPAFTGTLDLNGPMLLRPTAMGGSNQLWNNGGVLTWGSTNLTVAGSVTASGGPGYYPYFTSGTTLGSGSIYQDGSGNVGVGTTSPAGALDISSTSGALIPPRMTTTQRDALASPQNGSVIYNTTTNKMNFRENGAWVEVGSSGGGRTSCPSGLTLIGTSGTAEAFCISTSEEASGTWFAAVTACYNKSPTRARLCSSSEWAMACVSGAPTGMTGNGSEWVADLGGSNNNSGSNLAYLMGWSTCESAGNAAVTWSNPGGSRCCFR